MEGQRIVGTTITTTIITAPWTRSVTTIVMTIHTGILTNVTGPARPAKDLMAEAIDRAVAQSAVARFHLPLGPALHGEVDGSCHRLQLSPVRMSSTPPLSVNPTMAHQAPAACARLRHDTFLHQTTTEVSTTDHRHGMHLRTTKAPHPDMARHVHRGTSPHAPHFMDPLDPLIEAAGVVHRLGIVWRETFPFMSETTSMSDTMSLLHMSKVFPTEIHTHMQGILIPTPAHLGLPDMVHHHPSTHTLGEYPMAIAPRHLPHTDECPQVWGLIYSSGHHTPGGPARGCMNLTVRQMRMTGASDC